LAGTASAQVIAGQTVTANILLAGAVTRATVTPADGTLGVPTSTIITINTTAPLNPQSIVQSNLSLVKGPASAPGAPVPLQNFILSASGTTLTFAPVANLDPATQYTIQANGLADASGGAIAVPASSFTTKASAPLNFDPNAITFAFPDQNGNIHVSAPAGSLPPGTKVLIIDQGNAVVVSFTAFNDGSISGDFPGTINDVLQITVTDPNGATISFTRSQFVAPDGSVAVGPGGGTITGPGNTGLIIPQGTLIKAATFKLTPLDQTAFPQLPVWPGLSFGSGLHIDAPDKPAFNQEVKLAFPVPANAPSNAFYYVYRRLTDQDGKTYFETVDHAFVQGTGAAARVVTASPPFCGYHNPIGNFNIAAAASGAAAFIPQFSPFQDFILMWDIAQVDPNLPGVASPGLIVGLVQQTVPAVPGQSAQTTQPYITNVKISLDSDPTQVAVYDPKCSTFTLFDPRLGGGSRNITATAPAVGPDGSTQGTTMIHAVVDEVNGIQADDPTYGIFAGLENQYRNIGRVTITFPATTPPPPPPQLGIRLFSLDGNGHRVPATGILQTGTSLVIAFQSKLPVQGASISGTQLAVTSPDVATEVNDGQPEKLLLDARAVGTIPIGSAGTYTITATALDPLSQTRVTANQSFLAVAPGGGNNTNITCTVAPPPAAPTSSCTLPKVIDTAPLNGATSVSPSVFPQVTFNEPVSQVPGNVVLADHTGTPVPIQLIGVRPFDSNNPNANLVANPLKATDVITSLTLQPLFGLKYNETYTLTLNAKSTNGCVDSNNNPAPVPAGSSLIIDQNQPPSGPLCLEPFPRAGDPVYKFTTFGPQEIGGTSDQFASTRPVLIGNRAFMGEEINASLGGLASVDITDPTFPIDKGIGTGASFVGRPMDISGQATSPVTGGPLVAVAAGQPGIETIIPSNVWIYDVTNPDSPVRVAGVSATTSTTQDGLLMRIFMKDQFLYTSTFLKGLQVIDLQAAVSEYQSVFPVNPSQFGQAITTEGNGFATDTVVNTIPLFAKNYQNLPPVPDYTATMNDVKAADYVTGPPPAGSPAGTPGITQTLMVATGRLPLVIADPQQAGSNAVLYPASVGTTANNFPSLDPSPLNFQVQNPDNTISTYTLQNGRALALATLSTTDSLGNSNSEQIAAIVGSGNAPPLPDGTPAQSVFAVVNMVTNTGDPLHPVGPVVQGMLGLSAFATDIVIHGNLALVGTAVNKILLVSLVDPAHPVSAGEIDAPPGSIFGDRLAVSDDGLIVTSSFNFANGGLHLSSLGVVPQISVDPSGLLAADDGTTSEDIPIKYSIVGDLTQVSSAQVQVKDDTGAVVFTAAVPVQATGSITWPMGQKLHVTPDTISFQVQNPDGGLSEIVDASAENTGASGAAGATGGNPTPVILSASPSAVVVNASQPGLTIDPGVTIDIAGRNFLPSTQAQVIAADSDITTPVTLLPIQFVSPKEVKLVLTPDYFTQVKNWDLTLLNGLNSSNGYIIRVVATPPPPTPTLISIDPAKLDYTGDPQDTRVTLTGTNFVAGDTIVRAEFEDPNAPPALTAQVISPTTIQVLIPSEWQLTPLHTALFVASAQDPTLSSQRLDFQVGGDPIVFPDSTIDTPVDPATIPPDGSDGYVIPPQPAPPILSSVGDGFVALATSGAKQPITVVLQGSNFQAGASVVVNVEGSETTLSPTSISDTQAQVQVPPSLFQLKTYTFDLQLNLLQQQQGNPANPANQVHAQQQGNAGKVYFRDQDKFAWNKLGGFHRRFTAPGTRQLYYLMVPEDGFNKAVAVIGQNVLQPNGTKVTFDPANPALVDRDPSSTQAPVVSLKVSGKNVDNLDTTDLVANKNVKVNGQTVKVPVGTLKVQLLRPHRYDVYLHYVTEKAPQGANPANLQCANLPLLPKRFPKTQAAYDGVVNSLEAALNTVWKQQANVEFNVFPVQGPAQGPGSCQGEVVPEQVHYDLDGDTFLLTDPHQNIPGQGMHNNETNAVINAIQHPPLNPGSDDQIHIYFVKTFGNDLGLIDSDNPRVGPRVGTPYAMRFVVAGGTPPYAWHLPDPQLGGGQVPPGLQAANPANNILTISGTPQAPPQPGAYQYNFSISDSANHRIGFQIFWASVAAANVPNQPPVPNSPAATVAFFPAGANIQAPNCCTLGFVTKINDKTIFMDDLTAQESFNHVLAHEIGHALGLNHTHERLGQGQQVPCTLIQDLHAPDTDFGPWIAAPFDKVAISHMMFWATYRRKNLVLLPSPPPNQNHIGIQQWWQLNHNKASVGCHQ
jgi:hypothetical protein